jgi:hypothetical protein
VPYVLETASEPLENDSKNSYMNRQIEFTV